MQTSDVYYPGNLSESFMAIDAKAATSIHQFEEDWHTSQTTGQHRSSVIEAEFREPSSFNHDHTNNQFVMIHLTPDSQELEKTGKKKGEQDPWRNINPSVPREQLLLLDFSGRKSKQSKRNFPANAKTQSNKIELHEDVSSEQITEALNWDDRIYSLPTDEHELPTRQDPVIFNNSAYCPPDCVDPSIINRADLHEYNGYTSEHSIFGMGVDQTTIGHDVEGSLPPLRYCNCCGKVTNCNTGRVIGWINDMVGKCDEHLYLNAFDGVTDVQENDSLFASGSETSICAAPFYGAGAHLAQQQLWALDTSIDRNMLGLCLSELSGSPGLPSSTDSSLDTPYIPTSSSSELSASFLYPPTETFFKYPATHDSTFNDHDLLDSYSEESRIYTY